MPETLVFSLIANADRQIRFDALESAIVEMRRLIQNVDRAVFRSEGVIRKRPWYVQRLSTAYANRQTIAVAPAFDSAPLAHQVGELFIAGIRDISEGAISPPVFFSEQELQNLVDLKRRVLNKGLHHIEVSTEGETAALRSVDILPSIEERVTRILRGSTDALGSLDGELDAINIRHAPYFTMWEEFSQQAIRCHFEMERLDEVKSLLSHRVRVSGLVSYFANGRPRSVRRIEMLRDLSGREQPSSRDFFGSVPDLGGGRDIVEILRTAGE